MAVLPFHVYRKNEIDRVANSIAVSTGLSLDAVAIGWNILFQKEREVLTRIWN